MIVVIPEALLPTIDASSLQQWGIAACAGYTPERQHGTAETRAMIQPTLVKGELTAVTELIRVKYVWVEAGVVQHDFFEIPVTGYDDVADYYHVRYRVGGVAKYWMYRDGAGTYPTLDALFDEAPLSGGSFFPFAYFRHNHASEIADTNTEEYRTTKKLVKYLGMDYDEVAQAIDSNPEIEGVKQAVLMMAVPANTTSPVEQRYLWDFFNELFLASSAEYQYRSEEEATAYALSTEQLGLRSPGIVIQDTRFKMSLDNLGIYKRRKAGVIGKVGAHSSSLSSENLPYDITLENEVGTYTSQFYFNLTKHVYRRQISVGFYDEIQVLGLRTLFNILGSYTSIGIGEDRILLIPLDRSITGEYPIPDRESLYARSLHFVFNSFITTKLAWYESSLFQAVLFVVAIAITVISFGADGGAGAGFAAAIAAGAYSTAAIILITTIVEILIYKAIFKLFVKAVGIEAAFVIAIIAAVVSVSGVVDGMSVLGAPFADQLLMVSTGLIGGINAQTALDMQNLLRDASEFEAYTKEQLKLLDSAKDLLDNSSVLSPFVIFGEKPDDYYNRTIRSGNIGIVGISAISSFVEQALRLPELNDTLGVEI
jgi:hypothetical protein